MRWKFSGFMLPSNSHPPSNSNSSLSNSRNGNHNSSERTPITSSSSAFGATFPHPLNSHSNANGQMSSGANSIASGLHESSSSSSSRLLYPKDERVVRDPQPYYPPLQASPSHPSHPQYPTNLPSHAILSGDTTTPYIQPRHFLKNISPNFYSSLPQFSSPEEPAAYFYSQTCLPTSYDPLSGSPNAFIYSTTAPSPVGVPNLSLDVAPPPNAVSLAARLPHEILLQIFAYLLPQADLIDPFMDDKRIPDVQPSSRMQPIPSLPSSSSSSPSASTSAMNVSGTSSPTSQTSEQPMEIDTPMNMSQPLPPTRLSSSSQTHSTASPTNFTPSVTRPTYSHGTLFQPHPLSTPTTSPTHPFPLSSSPAMYSPTNTSTPASGFARPPTSPPTVGSQVFFSLPAWPQARPHYRHLYPCLFVCRTWYYAAIHYLHSDPVLENACDFVQWLACLEACAHTLGQQGVHAAAMVPTTVLAAASHVPMYPPGLTGFSLIQTLRFEHTNVVHTHHLSYRIPVKGSLPSPNMYLRDDHVNRMAQAFQVFKPAVRSLHLSNCVHITDVAIIHLITTVSSSLMTLDVTNCRHIKDVTVRTISRLCDQMQSLALRGCGKVGDASIKELAQFLGPQLTKLDLAGCMRINDPGLDMLAKFSGNVTPSPWESLRNAAGGAPLVLKPVVATRPEGRVGGKLQSLSIPGIRRQSRGGLVTFLQEIVQVHPNLRELEFSIPAPPSTSTKSIFSGSHLLFPSLQHLTSLTIRDCEYLDDANLEPIAKHCGRLHHLVLFNVVNMTEVSFTALIRSLTQLRTLVLRGARYLTDAHVAPLVQSECAGKLEKLDLTDCFELGDDTLYMLSTLQIVATNHPPPSSASPSSSSSPPLVPVFGHLKHVAMENCRRISFRGVLGLIKSLVNAHACPRWSKVVQPGTLVSLHVSGAWEGVTQKALVAYRERPGLPTVTREIHLATVAVRGLVRDEFDIGPIGSGGASMLWSILPNHQGRAPVPWFCRFARSSLKQLAHSYAWVPVPTRCQSLKPANQLPSIPGILFTVSPVPGVYIAYQQSNPEPQNQAQAHRPTQQAI